MKMCRLFLAVAALLFVTVAADARRNNVKVNVNVQAPAPVVVAPPVVAVVGAHRGFHAGFAFNSFGHRVDSRGVVQLGLGLSQPVFVPGIGMCQ